MSAELRVLRDPAKTFAELAASPHRGAWTFARRPLLLLFAMGFIVSLHSSGRLSVRAVADGMVSFAFLPAVEVIAIGVVYLRGDRRLPFSRVVDAFFVSNAPWLLWILGFAVYRATETPMQATAFSRTAAWVVEGSLLVPMAWAARLDLQFFRAMPLRSSGAPAADLIVERGIAWVAGLGYFFGIVAWAQFVEMVTR